MNFLTSNLIIQGWVTVPTVFFFASMGFCWPHSKFFDALIKVGLFAMCFVYLYFIFEGK